MDKTQTKEVEGESKPNAKEGGIEASSILPQIKINPPSPQRLTKKNSNAKFQKFMEIVKDLKVNIPLVDALTEIMGYTKYMKELVTKNRVIDCEIIEMSQACCAVMTKNVVLKKDDLKAFTIPCTICACNFAISLCDIGASINLIPLIIFNKLGL